MTMRAVSAAAFAWHRRTDAADTGTSGTWHSRVDRGQLLRPHKRPDGTLLVEGYAAREGVLEYRQADGTTRRELVTEETLRDSAKGLARAPVTLEHPREDVTPDNVGDLGVGDTDGEVAVEDGGFVRVRLAVRRRDAVDDVSHGRRTELSPGYRVRIDETPGVHPVHGPYDAVQVERKYNHLAIVRQARGGPEIRMRADSADVPAVATTRIERRTDAHLNATGPRAQGAGMDQEIVRLLAILGIAPRFDSDREAIGLACNELERRIAADRVRADEQQSAVTAAEAARDTAIARADAADKAKLAAEVARDAAVARADGSDAEVAKLRKAEQDRADAAERLRLERLAAHLRIDAKRHEGNAALKRALAAAHFANMGGQLRADATDAYVDATIDQALARLDAAEAVDADGAPGAGREAGSAAWRSTADNADPATARAPRRSTMSARWGGSPLARGGE